ncbi:hypothetical protein JTB14_037622 [Gonioctena quinquepunctata]|nr:hypothetical protein JTB14_037622 [Gonioctena quinquepunctata]
MFQPFAIIGTALVLLGMIYTFIFVRLILRNIKNTETILSLTEALVTVFIGVFYLYSAIILATNGRPDNPPENFTNTIDDIVTRNDSYESYYPAISMPNSTTHNVISELDENEVGPTEENVNETPPSINHHNGLKGTKDPLRPEVSKTDQFLMNYQKFIQDMMMEKIGNTSSFNRTFITTKNRTKKEIKFEEETPSCYYEFFLQNALLLYSFVHCLVTLLNKTLHCRKCITVQGNFENKTEEIEENIKSETKLSVDNSETLGDSNSEKNDNSAPVGPLFDTNEPSASTDVPNLKLFEAKSTKSQASSRNEALQPSQPMKKKENITKLKFGFPLQILFMWTLPIICVMILYCITKQEIRENLRYDASFLHKINFTETQADPNLSDIIENPVNISNPSSSEIDEIIKNVYNIVSQVRENVTKKTTYFTPLMIDIVYFLDPSKRNPKEFETSCPTIDTSMKLFYFFVFVASYVGIIFFAKIIQISAESKGVVGAHHQRNSLLSFSTLWLPSILDIFFRTYVTHGKSGILSDLFLALGNSNRIYTMASDHIQSRKYFNKPNFVNPLV